MNVGLIVIAVITTTGSIVAAWFAYRASTRAARVNERAAERENDREDFTVLVGELRTELAGARGELREARADIRVLVAWMREAVTLMRAAKIQPPAIPEKFDVY